MARNKHPEITVEKIMEISKRLFLEKGYDDTTIQDIVNELGGLTKGAIYHHFKSKEEIVMALCSRMFFDNNLLDAVKERSDINGVQKIQEILVITQSNIERIELNEQAISFFNNPHVLAAIIEINKRLFTPACFALIQEGIKDGSIQNEYTKELSELLPHLTLWIMPSVYPETVIELRQKFYFTLEMLTKMGLPLLNKDMKLLVKKYLIDM